MLPSTLPLFPLPNVVLFPGVFLPLHIFEARYRAMTEDALAGDRIIGMALLSPDSTRNMRAGRRSIRSGASGSSPMPSACRMAASTSCCRAWNGFVSSMRTSRASTALGSSNASAATSRRHRITATLRALRDRIETCWCRWSTRRRVDRAADDDRRRPHPRARTVPGPGADRKAGAARDATRWSRARKRSPTCLRSRQ